MYSVELVGLDAAFVTAWESGSELARHFNVRIVFFTRFPSTSVRSRICGLL
jgi:hypothetical protein